MGKKQSKLNSQAEQSTSERDQDGLGTEEGQNGSGVDSLEDEGTTTQNTWRLYDISGKVGELIPRFHLT